MISSFHAKYYAHELTKQSSDANGVSRISASLFNASVDLNPHQIEAALFALKSPLSKGELKLNIVSSLIKDMSSNKILKGLLDTLYKNKRLSILAIVLSSFGEVLLSKRGYKSANVTTASDIDDDTKKNISELLNSQYGSKINIEFKTNESLLGGMTVVVGSKMIDLSVRSQVSKFTNNVKGDI